MADAGLSMSDNAPQDSQQAASQEVLSEVDVKLYGEPFDNIPESLYIPPDALQVFLDTFEGPLDLLLYLIRKQNFDILDIPVAQVTAQYLHYVDQVRQHNFELAAEYLLMAAMLIEIKSRTLLPVKKVDTEELVEDPRAELVKRLLAYEQSKLAAKALGERPIVGRDIQRAQLLFIPQKPKVLPQVGLPQIFDAWQKVLERAKLYVRHAVGKQLLSVRAHMSSILRRLSGLKPGARMCFDELPESNHSVPQVVVNFLALLELAKDALVELTQTSAQDPIYIRTHQAQATSKSSAD